MKQVLPSKSCLFLQRKQMSSDLSHLVTKIRLWFCVLVALGLIFSGISPNAHAQLAGNFSNVTGIKVTRLGNAVLVRIDSDGAVKFGGDYNDWINSDNGAWELKPITSFRIRLVRARAKLPAYVPIDAYPVDGAAISLGRTPFVYPYFASDAGPNDEPKVDVELRFATPIRLRRFSVEPARTLSFGSFLGPKEASVALSNDRRSVLITVIPDRNDLSSAQRIDRLPRSERIKKLSVTPEGNASYRVEALHVPLRELLSELTVATGQKFAAREGVQDLQVSLFLNGSIRELLSAIISSCNLGVRNDGDTLILGRGEEFFQARSFPLNSVSPDKARLMFPDFLLPYLRVDVGQNGLIAFQTPPMLDKIERDLRAIDTQINQFEVGAQIWEIVRTKETDLSLSLLRSIGGDRQVVDANEGIVSLRIEKNQTNQLLAQLRALENRSGARLLGSPRVSVLSGATGSLFLGQTRYVKVLRQSGTSQIAQAMPLRIGTELRVTPLGSMISDAPVTLDIMPRVATVDELENLTGLPTLGIREFSSTIRVMPDDAVMLAGLESDLNFEVGQKTLKVLPARRKTREKRELIVLIWVKRTKDVNSVDSTNGLTNLPTSVELK
jgi:hypothetical protein